MNVLKPCPHCGEYASIAVMPVSSEYRPYYCVCGYCGARSGRREKESEAIEAWNRRAAECQSKNT